MKVLCVSGVKRGVFSSCKTGKAKIGDEIYEGGCYTVTDEMVNNFGVPVYELAERFHYYRQSRFIPLSSIDEKELAKEREGELVTN